VGFVVGQFGIPSDMGNQGFALGYMWVGWIAAGLSQLIPALLFVLSVALLLGYQRSKSNSALVLTFVIAFALGQFNFVSALGLAIYTITIFLVRYRGSPLKSNVYLYVFIATISGALLNYFSPGTRARADLVSQGASLFEFDNVNGAIKSIIGSVISDSLAMAVLLGLFIGLTQLSLNAIFLSQLVRTLSLAFLSAIVATFLIENLAFPEPWHYSLISLSTFVLVLVASIAVGQRIRHSGDAIGEMRAVGIAVGVIFSFFLALQVALITPQIQARSNAWTAGSDSPVGFIADREVEWIARCWTDIAPSDEP